MFCENCKASYNNNELFCTLCGQKLVEDINDEYNSISDQPISPSTCQTQNENKNHITNQQKSYQHNESNYQQQQYQQQSYYQSPYHQPIYQQQFQQQIPDEYRPISMWGYFGYEILFIIPFVGFILLLVFSFGGTRNYNLRNFARSYFCLLIILLILSLIFFNSILRIGFFW